MKDTAKATSRSISCGRWLGQILHIQPLRSTSARREKERNLCQNLLEQSRKLIKKYNRQVTLHYLLESAQRCKDGSTNPDTVLPLWRSDNLDLHAAWRERSDLLAHAVRDAREHGGSTTENNVAIQILSDINITLHDGVVCCLMDARGFHANDGRLEHDLRASEAL
uniref:Uncharacterized protein n=1 Tax=Oryza brachyantha TaxID=4533 RepID=J3N403_ORYBR